MQLYSQILLWGCCLSIRTWEDWTDNNNFKLNNVLNTVNMFNNIASNVTVTLLLLSYLQRSQDSELVAHKLRLFSEMKEEVKKVYVYFS